MTTCHHCARPLGPYQKYYCSVGCRTADRRIHPRPDSNAALEATYAAIVRLTADGLPTTIRAVQAATDTSATSVVAQRVRRLVAAGRVLQAAGISRSIRLPPIAEDALLRARIAALEEELRMARER